ncbi:MAG: hypothetical protein D4R73_00690 [Deltaproteobacteria bacterium]|nr:MAG: hypothetical protein D4R73_00690 [Deltaproteobacteria bacterium]
MDVNTINEISKFLEIDFRASEKLPCSGQREVFLAEQISAAQKCIVKICSYVPVRVARIQREIRILKNLDSDYFPDLLYQSFITDQMLEDFYDNFDPRSNRQRVEELKSMRLKAFLLTVEEYIEHISWDDCILELKKEQTLVDFLIHIFKALSLLWTIKIVHRDLKPENILIRGDLSPVIIDLGIAKSFREGTMDLTHYAFRTPCTPRYAAPEQLTNSKTEITYKTDQFSVGVIAYAILTNRFPYGDEREVGVEQVVDNLMTERVEDIQIFNENISDGMASLIHKLIQVKPYRRFRNAETIIQQLLEIRNTAA